MIASKTNGYALCDAAERPLGEAARAAVALLNATPLDHPERAQVDALSKAIWQALRIAQELDWETWTLTPKGAA